MPPNWKSLDWGRFAGAGLVTGFVALVMLAGCSEDDTTSPPPAVDIPGTGGTPTGAVDAGTGTQLPADGAAGAGGARLDTAAMPGTGSGTGVDAATTPGADSGSTPGVDAVGPGGSGGDAGVEGDAKIIPDGMPSSGACPWREEVHTLLPPPHVPSIEGMTFSSNPPSSGPHCPVWGAWTSYQPPIHLPRCNYIHNLEHGGIVILFRETAPNPALQAWMNGVLARLTQDPDCPIPRIVVTADPQIDSAIAAVAWGATFKVECTSPEVADGLVDFVTRHWGKRGRAPEAHLCTDGVSRGVSF